MIGLDIGTYSIKAIELQKKGNSFTLANFKVQDRPPEEPLAAVLSRFFGDVKFGSKRVNISVAGPLVLSRLIEMPQMSDEELKSAIRFEAEKSIPFSIDETTLDYQVISSDASARKVKLLFAAAKNDLVKISIDALMQCGFTVNSVDIDGIAITNAFLSGKPPADAQKCAALLNIGDSFSNFSVAYQGTPCILRDISIAGKDFTEEIGKNLSVSAAEALSIKHKFPDEKKDILFEVIRPVLEKLVNDTRLSLGYFEDNFQKGAADAVYLSGGSCRLFGLKEFFSETLSMKVDFWDPLSSFNIGQNIPAEALEGARHALAVAAGLAIRE